MRDDVATLLLILVHVLLGYNYAAYVYVITHTHTHIGMYELVVCVSRVCAVFVLSLRFMSERARKNKRKNIFFLPVFLFGLFSLALSLSLCCSVVLRVFIARRRCGRTKHDLKQDVVVAVVVLAFTLEILLFVMRAVSVCVWVCVSS